MIRTKQQADIHVSSTLKQIKNDKERSLRGYQFAKLYFDIKEYEMAKRYLSGFLAVKDNTASAYKLFGQICDAQDDSSHAVDAYKRSLELDHQQPDLLLRVCEIYCTLNISADMARYWAEKAHPFFPSHDVVLTLKEKALAGPSSNVDNHEILELYLRESTQNPLDVGRKIKLLNHYMKLGHIEEAYTLAIKVEDQHLFNNSLAWYQCIIEIYKKYERNGDESFDRHYLSALNEWTALSIAQSQKVTDAIAALWSLDEALLKHYRQVSSFTSQDAWTVFYRQMEAQYLFHCGTLLLNKAQKDRLSWKDASNLSAACFMVSCAVDPPSVKAAWFAKANNNEKRIYDHLYTSACYRCSQSGHMLNNLLKDHIIDNDRQRWIERIQEEYCHQQGKEKLFQVLYTLPIHKNAKERSYLVQSDLITSIRPELPDGMKLKEFDAVSQKLMPSSLEFAVWTALQYYTVRDKAQSCYVLPFEFETLPYGVNNLSTATPESLCQLDLQAFLMAVVYSTALVCEERRVRHDPYRPYLLPLAINERLCPEGQSEWWACAYRLHTATARDNLGQQRAVLQRGLETIRLVGVHSMSVELLIHLARSFIEQFEEKGAEESVSNSDLDRLESFSSHYWTKAIELLEKLEKYLTGKERNYRWPSAPKYCLFESRDNVEQISVVDVRSYLDEGRLFRAKQALKFGRHTEATRLLEQINTAEAAFELAQLYKDLSKKVIIGRTIDETDDSGRNQIISLLNKSKDALHLTLDRLKGDKYHSLNSRVADEIDEVESGLMRLAEESHDCTLNEKENVSRGPASLYASSVKLMSTPNGKRNGVKMEDEDHVAGDVRAMAHSTPCLPSKTFDPAGAAYSMSSPNTSGRLRPSPDRLDAQIRSLNRNQEHHDQYTQLLKEQIKENRINIQTLEKRVTMLECKLEQSLEQQKSQLAAAAAATAAATHLSTPSHHRGPPVPGLLPHPPPQMMFPQPSTAVGVGYAPSPHHATYDASNTSGYYPNYSHPPPPMGQQPAWGAYPGGSLQHHPSSIGSRGVQEEIDYEYDDDYGMNAEQAAYIQEMSAAMGLPAFFPGGGEGAGFISQTNGTGATPALFPALQPGFFTKPIKEHLKQECDSDVNGNAGKQSLRGLLDNRNSSNGGGAGGSVDGRGAVSSHRVPPPVSRVSEPQQLNRSSEDPDENDADSSYPDPQFEPIVTLPDEVDLVTGEEDEVVMFEDRAKLFRFVDKQWKERGTGNIKILRSKAGTRCARLVMRRDQVHTVCANHYIKADITLKLKTSSDPKILTWFAMDATDLSEPRLEQFCIKFKTDEIATHFKLKFEEAKSFDVKCDTHKVTPAMGEKLNVQQPPSTEAQKKFPDVKSTSIPAASGGSLVSLPSKISPLPATATNLPVFGLLKSNVSVNSGTSTTHPVFTLATSTPSPSITAATTNILPPTANTVNAPKTTPVLMPSKFAPIKDKDSATNATAKPSSFGASTSTSGTPASTSEGKTTLGGFTFSAQPKVAPATTVDAKNKTDTPKPANPFASFQFGTSQSTPIFGAISKTDSSTAVEKKDSLSNTSIAKPVLFGSTAAKPPSNSSVKTPVVTTATSVDTPLFGSSGAEVSFASLAASASPASESNTPAGFTVKLPQSGESAFQKAGQKVFGRSPAVATPKGDGGDDDKETPDDDGEGGEYEPMADFKPIVSLPVVEVKTGEEGEEKLFGERAKLYRMDGGQWKERGLGEIKIMRNPTTGRARIIMRREQVLKLCANHSITAAMRLAPVASSETSWCWTAQDYSEGEVHDEQLCIRFKPGEYAQKFKECFEQCQKELAIARKTDDSTANLKVLPVAPATSTKPSMLKSLLTDASMETKPSSTDVSLKSLLSEDSGKAPPTTETKPSLSELFKTPAGGWECSSCYVKNVGNTAKCVACETPKVPAADTSSSLSSLFKAKAGEWACDACYVKNTPDKTKCAACETPKPGSTATAEEINVNAPAPGSSFKFGSLGGFSFGSAASTPGVAGSFAQGFKSFSTKSLPTADDGSITGTKPSDDILANPVIGGFRLPSSSSFTFGAGKSADTMAVGTNTPTPVFGFGKTSTPIFGTAKAADTNKPSTTAAPAFTLGALDDPSATGKSAMEGFKFSAMPPPTSVPGKPLFALSTTKPVVNEPKANDRAVAPVSQLFGKDSKTAVDLTMPTKTSSDNKPQFAFTPSFSFPKPDTSSTLKDAQPPGFNFSLTIPSSVTETPATPTTSSKSKATGVSVTKTPQSPTSPDGGLYQNSDEEGDHIHFEPIVKLPDNVVLVTGEEDEEALYEHRAKLYRFVDSQWKERGVGDVKILRHKGTDRGRLRVVMRREKLFKICLNHAITADMKLTPMGQDGTSLSFHAENFVDGELIHEKLCLRFKTSAIASDYNKAFDSAVAEVKLAKSMSSSHGNAKDAGNSSNGAWRSSRVTADEDTEPKDDDNANDDNDESCQILKVTLPSNDLIAKARQYLLPDTFYNYIQSPACPGCAGCSREEADFDEDDIKDVATEPVKPTKTKAVFAPAKFQLKPSSTDLTPKSHTPMSSTSSIASPFQKVEGIGMFQPKLDSTVTTGNNSIPAKSNVMGSVLQTSLLTPPVFESQAQESIVTSTVDSQQPEAASVDNPSAPVFGVSANTVDFASLAMTAGTNSTGFAVKSKTASTGWSGAGSTVFGSSSSTPKTSKTSVAGGSEKTAKVPGTGRAEDDEEGGDDVEAEPDVHFQPIVQLPEVVDLTTGEENEDVAFKERAKLFRFDSDQWKERGVGDLKILKNRNTGSYRLLMRREQVFKVVCNHAITQDMKLNKMATSEQAWCWYAQDFSEDGMRVKQFAAKFKNITVADDFKNAFENCQQTLPVNRGPSVVSQSRTVIESGGKESNVVTSPAESEPQPLETSTYESANTSAVTVNDLRSPSINTTAAVEGDEVAEEEEQEEERPVFCKRATLFYVDGEKLLMKGIVGEIVIVPDSDVIGLRVRMLNDAKELICNHIICCEYEVKRTAKSCEWTAKDFRTDDPAHTSFRVTFSSESAAKEFEQVFHEVPTRHSGLHQAHESDLSESKDEVLIDPLTGKHEDDTEDNDDGGNSQ